MTPRVPFFDEDNDFGLVVGMDELRFKRPLTERKLRGKLELLVPVGKLVVALIPSEGRRKEDGLSHGRHNVAHLD